MRDLVWSPAEKAIARKAFNQALERQFAAVYRRTREMAAKIAKPEDLWKLERYLARSRKEIDEKFDYRYSVLLMVFGRLIEEGLLSEEELQGLAEDKLSHIRAFASL